MWVATAVAVAVAEGVAGIGVVVTTGVAAGVGWQATMNRMRMNR
jgi:hypothetical protein